MVITSQASVDPRRLDCGGHIRCPVLEHVKCPVAQTRVLVNPRGGNGVAKRAEDRTPVVFEDAYSMWTVRRLTQEQAAE